jgi:hypothetical protein
MQDSSDRFQAPAASVSGKRLGGYLVEAGLITPAQVDVALNDQKITDGMRFGEILSARGWVKQQTIEYFMKKIVEPERQAVQKAKQKRVAIEREAVEPRTSSQQFQAANATGRPVVQANPYERRPIGSPINQSANERKPLPSISTSDDDVSWVG